MHHGSFLTVKFSKEEGLQADLQYTRIYFAWNRGGNVPIVLYVPALLIPPSSALLGWHGAACGRG